MSLDYVTVNVSIAHIQKPYTTGVIRTESVSAHDHHA